MFFYLSQAYFTLVFKKFYEIDKGDSSLKLGGVWFNSCEKNKIFYGN